MKSYTPSEQIENLQFYIDRNKKRIAELENIIGIVSKLKSKEAMTIAHAFGYDVRRWSKAMFIRHCGGDVHMLTKENERLVEGQKEIKLLTGC